MFYGGCKMTLKQKLKNISKELQGSTFSSADDYAERVAKRAVELFVEEAEKYCVEVICVTGLRENKAVRWEKLKDLAKEVL